MRDIPVKRSNPFAEMPRCLARNRRGGLCQRVAGPKGRCRLHGGAYGSGGPWGDQNGQYRHGRSTRHAVGKRRAIAEVLRELRSALEAALAADDSLTIDIAATDHRVDAISGAVVALLPLARAVALANLLRWPNHEMPIVPVMSTRYLQRNFVRRRNEAVKMDSARAGSAPDGTGSRQAVIKSLPDTSYHSAKGSPGGVRIFRRRGKSRSRLAVVEVDDAVLSMLARVTKSLPEALVADRVALGNAATLALRHFANGHPSKLTVEVEITIDMLNVLAAGTSSTHEALLADRGALEEAVERALLHLTRYFARTGRIP